MKVTFARNWFRSLSRGALAALSLLLGNAAALAQDEIKLYAWGYNGYGHLGDGTTTARQVPGSVKGPAGSSVFTNATYLASGETHALAIRTDGTVYTWGQNAFGELGDGTTTPSLKPVQVVGPGGNGVLTDVEAVVGTYRHSLALKTDGTLWVWGYGAYGQLGTNNNLSSPTPVQVKGPNGVGALNNVIQIAGGDYHSVALKNDGTVWAWGYNGNGQLGDGTTVGRAAPVQVKGPDGVGFLTGVAAIAAGDNATYAVKTNGTLWAWGTNIYNELGDGTTTSRNTPVQVKGPNGVGFLTGVVAVAAGDWHAVALKSNGTVWGWGWNGEGSIGDNTTTQRATPVQVVGLGGVGTLTNITQIASDEYSTLALKSDGTAWAWGGNGYGELGDNTTTQRRAPVQVVGPNGVGFLNSVTTLAASVYTGHALRADGTVWSWGYGANGQLATDTTANSSTPIRAVSPNGLGVFPGARAIVSGYYHTLVLKTDGTVYGFGYNIEGELGDGTTSHRSVAVQTRGPGGVGVLEDVLFIAAGGYHSVALKEDGTVWAWGWNANGQLGDGTQTNRNTPVQVMGLGGNGFLTNIVAIAAGSAHTLALRRDGRVFGWGANSYGGLGNVTGSGSTYPTEMVNENGTGPLGAIISIAAGDYHSLMLGANGRVFATGYNVSGQLGDNTTTNRSRPVRVVGPGGSGALTDVVSIAAGGQFSLGLKFDGTVFAWGQNSYGQLGDNTTTDRHAPVPVVGPGGAGTLANVATVAAGRNHALAVKFDGTVWAWGLNDNGQLGDNTGVNRPAPVQAKGPEGNGFLESIFSVSAGNSHSVAINGEGILQGNVILQSAICSGALITFEFRPQPGGTPFLRTIIAGPLGLFTFNDIPPGTYDVAVKGSKWLQRVIPDVNTNNNVLNLRVFLLTGDANDDNSVDVLDLDALIRAFDKMEGDPGWNMNADFNCDESVDVLDLDLLIQNFDLVGDP